MGERFTSIVGSVISQITSEHDEITPKASYSTNVPIVKDTEVDSLQKQLKLADVKMISAPKESSEQKQLRLGDVKMV